MSKELEIDKREEMVCYLGTYGYNIARLQTLSDEEIIELYIKYKPNINLKDKFSKVGKVTSMNEALKDVIPMDYTKCKSIFNSLKNALKNENIRKEIYKDIQKLLINMNGEEYEMCQKIFNPQITNVSLSEAEKDLEYVKNRCMYAETKSKGNIVMRRAYIDCIPNIKQALHKAQATEQELDKFKEFFNNLKVFEYHDETKLVKKIIPNREYNELKALSGDKK